ncbi:hypothetical protein RPB_3067 [Rhodopseudomonas palustris HaA2]|uniref:Secreted protein n=1 Tax=Rhodopseudomonas palustris (strain HaA2) TaxID=316058 RepID=Q2IVJ2_RHOP2|nr:hypothetical protein [Rhodopseudomonas palustris]ABD07768.1 hypothetical protein RPB_3067 [Rhodopseudomonas palustris HaA2]
MKLRIALAVGAFACLTTVAPLAFADATTQIMHANAQCYVTAKGGSGVDCQPNKKFPNKKIDFTIVGTFEDGKPVKFRNPTAMCMLSWFDGKMGCYAQPNDPSDKTMIWKTFNRDGKGYQIQNVGANCWLHINPDGLDCSPDKPDPREDAYYWNLLG